jgi:hypothetical protein
VPQDRGHFPIIESAVFFIMVKIGRDAGRPIDGLR